MRKRRENYTRRIIAGSIAAVLVHAGVLLVFQIFINLNLADGPEYPEPIVISLANETIRDEIIVPESQTTGRKEKAPSDENTKIVKKSTGSTKVIETAGFVDDKSKEETVARSDSGVQKKSEASKEDTGPTPAPTAYKSVIEKDNLASLDSALGPGDGDEPVSSKTVNGTGDGSTQTSQDGPAASTIRFEDNRSRSPLSVVQPKIPDWVSRQGLRLQANLAFDLAAEGFITNITVERSTGYTEVDNALVDALRLYRFEPSRNAKRIKGTIVFIIDTK